MSTNDGGPAFPHTSVESRHSDSAPYEMTGIETTTTDGMSLRDYFAAKALAALISHRDLRDSVEEIKVAKEAYGYADAMLEARGA